METTWKRVLRVMDEKVHDIEGDLRYSSLQLVSALRDEAEKKKIQFKIILSGDTFSHSNNKIYLGITIYNLFLVCSQQEYIVNN